MIWTLHLPDEKPPLSLNRGQGRWQSTFQDKARLRKISASFAEEEQIPHHDHIYSRLYWCPPDNRRRDEDNVILTAKPLWDGLVDAGVIDDDTSTYITKLMPKILKGKKGPDVPRVWLSIWTQKDDEPE